MNSKTLIWIGVFIGGTIGGYIPIIFGADGLSFTSIICSGIGSLVGIWVGFKLSQ
ncbi:MAG: hypothetical protein NT077_03815 [Candidatus Taylorbacteria bacterium]|nr:hypothetical protein [Candidatus Taylorbacteria bacterium]